MKKYTYGILVTALFGLVISTTVSALSYSQDIGVSFTFNPTLKVTLSSADIHIDNLAPGTVNDSNIVNVNILSNVSNGYTLTATVGNDSLYDTKDLLHTSSTITSKFSSIDFSSSLASNTELSDNTWGYSYLDESLNNGTNTTWTNYSGLPLYSDDTNIATLKTSTTPASSATGDNIKFKISARASLDQPSGEYRNVINFNIVATPVPKTLYMAYEDAGKEKHNGYFKMQDMTSDICNATDVIGEGSVMNLIDIRDNSVYTATKLADNKCWMTQNLRLVPDSTAGFSAENTNNPTAEFINQSRNDANNPWCITFAAGCTDQMIYDDSNLGNTTVDDHGYYRYEHGVYYNWWTVTAGNGTFHATSVAGDICPYGWSMANAHHYDGLLLSVNGDAAKLVTPPINLTFSGAIIDGTLVGRAESGAYWAGADRSVAEIWDAKQGIPISMGVSLEAPPYNGYSIRCVSK